MSIDPTNFEAQGKPTRAQAGAVWDSTLKPSARKVAEKLVSLGYQIGWRTIARWHASNWQEPVIFRVLASGDAGERIVNMAIKTELATIPVETIKEASAIADAGGIEGALAGGKLTDVDYARIDSMITELREHSEIDLDAIEAKERKIMNIVMMREATRRAHIMVLIPKDTSAFVSSMTDAARVVPTGKDTPEERNGNEARAIEGRVILPSALSLKLKSLRENAA